MNFYVILIKAGESRYICAELPYLPFKDNRFDIALSSHFLFLYSDSLSLNFHAEAIDEMLRVAGEVRIFPILDMDSNLSPFFHDIEEIFDSFDTVKKVYGKGSLIIVDNAISVFAEHAKAGPKYEEMAYPVIIKHLESCRPKEVGRLSERVFVCVNKNNAGLFKETLLKRRTSLTEVQKKRIDKLLKKIEEGKYFK